MTIREIEERYAIAEATVQMVYDKIYSDNGSELLDDLVHDNLLYQLQGMREEVIEIIHDAENHADEISNDDFKNIDDAVAYALSVDIAIMACNGITPSPFC